MPVDAEQCQVEDDDRWRVCSDHAQRLDIIPHRDDVVMSGAQSAANHVPKWLVDFDDQNVILPGVSTFRA